MLLQRDGTALGDHQLSVAADGGYPGREILDIGDRGGQSDDADLPGKMDDDLLPDRTAEPVGEVMDLVEYDEPQRVEHGRMLVEHVAQYLGRHDDDVGLGVDRDVARQQPDAVGTVNGGQVMVLLVAQRLDRRGVERLDIALAGQIHREVGHHGLAGARRGRDEHVLPAPTRLSRPAGNRPGRMAAWLRNARRRSRYAPDASGMRHTAGKAMGRVDPPPNVCADV